MDEKPPVIIKLLLLIGVGLAWTSLVTHRFDLLHGTWSLCNNNNNNNTLIYIAPACRMTSEALADSSSSATECLTEK